ncbi:MAG TPA: class I SAM-dependent methyltransferase [Bryobacteraceae bacterium]|nr:class I SAM-dependent methyltransferase [Bryobacteraceae bacterium]
MAEKWDSALYDDRHSFVWKKASDLLDLLDPKPGEHILDLGCGTGHLTAQIAARGAIVTGLDASASMIAQARINYPKIRFVLADAAALEVDELLDAVFSNAVLHWIRDAPPALASVQRALKQGGRFVFEMGAKGNNQRVLEAVKKVLAESGYEARFPWFFPSAGEYATLLENVGFEIQTLWTFDRWTQLEHPEKGLREWLEMFGASCFESVPANMRPEMIEEIESRLRPVLWRDGSWWIDYRRLRVIARRIH